MKARHYINMMGMAAAVLLSSCVKDTLYDTPHPDKGAVTVSLTGVSADEDFAVDIDGKVADITGLPFTYPDLLAPGTYRMVVYNRAEGFTFDGRMARVNAHTDGTSVISLPGYLKSISQEITVTADDTLRLSPVPMQRVRDLQLELEVTQGRPELIQSVTATLSGIAGIPVTAASSRPTPACWARWEPCRRWYWTSSSPMADAHSTRKST